METNSSEVSFICQICLDSLASPAPPNVRPVYKASMPGVSKQLPPNVNETETDLRDLIVTACGHLYHNVCLQRWFQNCKDKSQGQRCCPACRQQVPKKKGLIRVYPAGFSEDGKNQQNDDKADDSEEEEEVDSMKDILHKTLVKDHDQLLVKYYRVKNEETTKDALISSLREDNNKKDLELKRLRSILMANQVEASPPPSKRRRS